MEIGEKVMSPAIIFLIVGVVIVAIVGIAVGSIVNSIKKSARRATRQLTRSASTLGTAALLMKTLSEIDPKELNVEPGPKSISGMTKLLLPQIGRDFPDFEYNEAKSRAETVLLTYLSAITQQDASILSEGTSELKKEVQTIINNLKALGHDENFDNIRIHQTELSQYRKTSGKCIITFQMSVEYYRYKVKGDGTVISGSKEQKVQTRYNVDMVYIQNREIVENTLADAKGINCPNCGAPLTMLGAKHCSYCGAAVLEYNLHAWNFCNVDEFDRV